MDIPAFYLPRITRHPYNRYVNIPPQGNATDLRQAADAEALRVYSALALVVLDASPSQTYDPNLAGALTRLDILAREVLDNRPRPTPPAQL